MLYNHQHKIYASAENLQKKFNYDANNKQNKFIQLVTECSTPPH